MNLTLLTKVGVFLYGADWKTPMARDLKALGMRTTDRTIRRWLDGTYKPPARLQEKVVELLATHRRTLEEIEDLVDEGASA